MEKVYYIGIGDIHGETANLARIPELPGAAGVIISGDMTNLGGPQAVGRIVETVKQAVPVVFAQPGNMDRPETAEWLEENGVSIHRTVRELAPGVKLMGVGFSSPTPFNTPGEFSDEQIGRWLEETHSLVGEHNSLVLVVHDPPFGTNVDKIGGGVNVGSQAVREFIERVQPDVCLVGHIHESACEDMLGRTKVVNPGMLAAGGYVLISIESGKVEIELKHV